MTEPERRLKQFPHQLSGGMCQRVMIAIAIACKPKLLIADEPTTALDVTIQAQILDLLVALRKETGNALILVTHDMGVVAETAERVIVQYAGPAGRAAAGRRAVRDAAPSLHGGACSRRCPSAAAAAGSPPFRAWCRACTIVPTAACSIRAAASRARPAASIEPPRMGPDLGEALCHTPLQDALAEAPA